MNSFPIRKPFSSNNNLILGLAIILLVGACYLNLQNSKPVLALSKQDTAININTKFLMLLSAGNKRLMTDILWTQTLLESDMEHYKKKDLNSWLFLRFNTISELDPKFYQNYLYGGQFLSIVKDDLEGAKILYSKGLKQYPLDYNLNFQMGFLYYFEEGNSFEGLKYLQVIEKHQKMPVFFKSVINKLRYAVGDNPEAIYNLVWINYQSTKSKDLKKILRNNLYAIRADIDLKCLNSKGMNCNRIDLDREPYKFDGLFYTSAKTYKPFRVKTRNK